MVAASTQNPYVGVGLYTVREAARILQVPTSTLTRWAEGYTFTSRGGKGRSRPIFDRDIPALAEEHVLTFADLIELKLVHLFRREGVSMPTIKRAQEILSARYGTNHPFTVRRVRTDGKRLFDEAPGSGKVYEELLKYQYVLDVVAEPFFRKLDYEEESVRRYWPIGQERRVVLDPQRAFGKPIEARSGVPTFSLYQMSRAGESIEAIADWYEVEPEGVEDAIEFESELPLAA